MTKTTVHFTCPHCGHQFSALLQRPIARVSQTPEEAEQNKTMTLQHPCEACFKSIEHVMATVQR